MRGQHVAAGAALIIMVGLLSAGCTGTGYTVDEPGYEQQIEDAEYIPEEAPEDTGPGIGEPGGPTDWGKLAREGVPDEWVCVYAPTMNDNWHDDVICRRGTQVERPSLREDDDFITEDEMIWEAQQYQDWLNS